jgi:hypothetical protein
VYRQQLCNRGHPKLGNESAARSSWRPSHEYWRNRTANRQNAHLSKPTAKRLSNPSPRKQAVSPEPRQRAGLSLTITHFADSIYAESLSTLTGLNKAADEQTACNPAKGTRRVFRFQLLEGSVQAARRRTSSNYGTHNHSEQLS